MIGQKKETEFSLANSYTSNNPELARGLSHFRIQTISDNKLQIKISLGQEQLEQSMLKNKFFVQLDKDHKLTFDEKNQITIPKSSTNIAVYFDGKQVGTIQNNEFKQSLTLNLSEMRAIATANDSSTVHQGLFNHPAEKHKHEHKHEHEHQHEHGGRIDGHTHYVAAFSMHAAMESAQKAQQAKGSSVFIPSLVILKILQATRIITNDNLKEWQAFFKETQIAPTSDTFQKSGQKTDYSDDLLKEDFTRGRRLKMPGSEACVSSDNKVGYYVSFTDLQKKLTPEQLGIFYNGFDMSATHLQDFTEHMEMTYNLRNWFAKDGRFLSAQVEAMHEAYQRKGVTYAELPAGFFKKPRELKEFIKAQNDLENKETKEKKVILRPGLSIGRLLDPAVFRKTLFDDYLPLIIKYPELASVSVLAHETNPTTEHILAINEFVRVVNQHRPGFTVEVHAGETEAYGEVNIREARVLARRNPFTFIRAGHALYGDHTGDRLPNYIEERCPISNGTLIQPAAEELANTLIGIAEGKSRIFWGSDGCIYDSKDSPEDQKSYYMRRLNNDDVIKEIENRFKHEKLNTFKCATFDEYKTVLVKKLHEEFNRNELGEGVYIQFKNNEKEFHTLQLNAAKLKSEPKQTPDEATLHLKMSQLITSISSLTHPPSDFEKFQTELQKKRDELTSLNKKYESIHKALSPEIQEKRDSAALTQLMPPIVEQRKAAKFYNDLYKLNELLKAKDTKHAASVSDSHLDALKSTLQSLPSPLTHQNILEAMQKLQQKDSLHQLINTHKDAISKQKGDLRFELILDPHYEHHQASILHEQNNQALLAQSQAKTLLASESSVVIFGNPEYTEDKEKQKEYMEKLYKNIYLTLKDAQKPLPSGKPIILLGVIEEGINPLVYQVLADHPNDFKEPKVNIQHIVSNDESIANLKKSDGEMVSYYVMESKRQEVQIGYGEVLYERNCRNIKMFGGGAGIWADLSKVIDVQAKQDSGSGLVQYYQDGFKTTSSSSEYAYGVERAERKFMASQSDLDNAPGPAKKMDCEDSKYYDRYTKTQALHRNLINAFHQLDFLFMESKIPFKLSLCDFLNTCHPLDQADYSKAQANTNNAFNEMFSIIQTLPPDSATEMQLRIREIFDAKMYEVLPVVKEKISSISVAMNSLDQKYSNALAQQKGSVPELKHVRRGSTLPLMHLLRESIKHDSSNNISSGLEAHKNDMAPAPHPTKTEENTATAAKDTNDVATKKVIAKDKDGAASKTDATDSSAPSRKLGGGGG